MSHSSSKRLWLLLAIAVAAVVAVFFWRRGPRSASAASTGAGSTAASATAAASSGDTRAGLEAARVVADPRLRAREFGLALEAWLLRDLEAALAYVRQLPEGTERTQAILMAISVVARTDVDRALALARELAITREQRAIYNALFAQLATSDLAAAVQRLATVPGGFARMNALRAVADVWAARDAEAVLAWAEKFTDSADRTIAMEAALAGLARQSPQRAIALAQEKLGGASLQQAILAFVPRLIESDPVAAAQVVAALPSGEAKRLVAAEVARTVGVAAPQQALAWAGALTDASARQIARRAALEVWALNDPVSSSLYVAAMPADAAQVDAAEQVARVLGSRSPAQAAAWVQTLSSPEARQAAAISAASSWAQSDPSAAAQWASNLVVADGRLAALRGVLSHWVRADAASTQAFVAGLSADVQPAAAAAIAPPLAQRDPAGALAWAQSLPTPQAREEATLAAYGRWRQNAPASAEAWLAGANLSAEFKARLAGKK